MVHVRLQCLPFAGLPEVCSMARGPPKVPPGLYRLVVSGSAAAVDVAGQVLRWRTPPEDFSGLVILLLRTHLCGRFVGETVGGK